MATGFIGIGTIFNRWNGSEWVAIANILDLPTVGDKTRDTVDVTTMDSADRYREFISGLKDAGTVTFSMIFTPDDYDVIDTDFESSTNQEYQIVLPNTEGTTFEFEGLVTNLGMAVPLDDKVTNDVTIKISGKIEKDPSA